MKGLSSCSHVLSRLMKLTCRLPCRLTAGSRCPQRYFCTTAMIVIALLMRECSLSVHGCCGVSQVKGESEASESQCEVNERVASIHDRQQKGVAYEVI